MTVADEEAPVPATETTAGSAAAEARERLFLIDGYSTLFRAFYAIRALSNSKGEPTNAVYGFVTMLRKLLREEKPHLLGVALDTPEKTFREDRFADYKAQRAPMPDDLKPQLPWLRRVLEAYRIPILEYPTAEADDVLATLAVQARDAGFDVVLVTADKDLFQLVGPGISLLHTGRERLYDAAAVEEDFGVSPEKVIDVLALQGDAVDNVPGVPGIGEKGARQLIREFGSLEALLDRAAEVPRKAYREGLLAHREQALLSKELVTVHRGLPLRLDATALRLEAPDREALKALWAELEFFSLLEELRGEERQDGSTGDSAGESAPAALSPPALPVADAEGWVRALASARVDEAPRLAVAVVGEPVLGLVFTAMRTEGVVDPPVFADLRRQDLRAVVAATLGNWLEDADRELVGHDLKEVLRWARQAGVAAARAPRATLFDTQLVSYLLRPALSGHGLEEVALDRLRHSMLSAKESGFSRGANPPLPDDPRTLAFAAEQVAVPARVAAILAPEIGVQPALLALYREIEAPLIPVLVAMEETGILLDRGFLAAMSAEVAGEVKAVEDEIFVIAGEPFNLNSPQQLGVILFEKLQYPVLGRTKKTKNYTTGAETLEELATRGFPVAEKLLRWRELTKLKSTYIDALPTMVGGDGRIHTRYLQAGAATGRLSSVNPNLQNIPVRSGLGQRIRRAFRAAPGWRLVVADYNQIELRVLAHIAGEEALLDAFRRGEDVHRATAATVFNVAPALVSGDQRRAAKVINFGILYGMSAFGLGRTLGIPSGEADRFIKAYLERFPAVKRYMDETLQAAQRDGKVETLWGRARHLPDIHAKNFALRENARRMAINARIQGTAADILKKAMIAVDRRLIADGFETRLLLTVHDELVLESPLSEVDGATAIVRAEMEGVAELAVPLTVDVGHGETWGDAK